MPARYCTGATALMPVGARDGQMTGKLDADGPADEFDDKFWMLADYVQRARVWH